jgi:hypothetical protein
LVRKVVSDMYYGMYNRAISAGRTTHSTHRPGSEQAKPLIKLPFKTTFWQNNYYNRVMTLLDRAHAAEPEAALALALGSPSCRCRRSSRSCRDRARSAVRSRRFCAC